MKKIKVHRPDECTCRNCCHTEAELRWARHNRMVRLTGRGNRWAADDRKIEPAYKKRAFRKKYPPLFGTRRQSLKRFYRWKTSIWEFRQRMKTVNWESVRATTAQLSSEVKSDESSD